MFQIKVVEESKTHILCSVTFSRKFYRFWDNSEKYVRARQATDDGIVMVHALCILKNWGYRHTLRICIAYCFSVATTVAWHTPQCYVYMFVVSLVSDHFNNILLCVHGSPLVVSSIQFFSPSLCVHFLYVWLMLHVLNTSFSVICRWQAGGWKIQH